MSDPSAPAPGPDLAEADLCCPFTGVRWSDKRAHAAVERAIAYFTEDPDRCDMEGRESEVADRVLENLRGDEHLPGRRSLILSATSRTALAAASAVATSRTALAAARAELAALREAATALVEHWDRARQSPLPVDYVARNGELLDRLAAVVREGQP